MRDREIGYRAPGTLVQVGARTPRFSNIEIGADTLAPRITRLRPRNLRVSDRARDPKLVESFVERLKNLVVANNRSTVIPGDASEGVETHVVKDLPTLTVGPRTAPDESTSETHALLAPNSAPRCRVKPRPYKMSIQPITNHQSPPRMFKKATLS